MPIIDVVNNRLIFPLLGIGKLHHGYCSYGAIEEVEEFTLHLITIVNALKCKVYKPIKGIPLERLNKLFYQ